MFTMKLKAYCVIIVVYHDYYWEAVLFQQYVDLPLNG